MIKRSLLFMVYASTMLPCLSNAQENKRIYQKETVKNKISFFIAGGSSFASGKMKDSLFIRNGSNIEAGAYMPFFYNGAHSIKTTGGGEASYFTAGIEVNINYAQHKADGSIASYTNAFRMQNGTINPLFEGGTPDADLFQVLAGPKITWTLGKIAVSPSVLSGFLSLNRKSYILSDVIANPKQGEDRKNIPFITSETYSKSGFVVKPQITIDYYFTPQFSVFAGGAVSFGPSVQNSIAYWKPEGRAETGNTYSYDQFINGAAKTATYSSRWQTASINLGLRYTWIKNTTDKEHSNKKKKPATSAKPGGAVSSSYAAGRAGSSNTGSDTPQGTNAGTDFNTTRNNRDNRISTNTNTGSTDIGVGSDSSMPGRLSMTPTTPKQSQGQTFGEKVAQGMGGNHSLYEPGVRALPGNPIGGIIVKGGKNPGTNDVTVESNNDGEVLLNNLHTGNYRFQISLPGQSASSIAVKGGKNPGENFTNLTVNNDGQISFDVLEPGNYKLIIQTPEAPGTPAHTEKTKKKVVEKATSGLKDTLKTNV